MPKKQTPFTFRFVFYKYDISDKQDKSDVEYEILFSEVINNGFFQGDLSWLEEELESPELHSYECCSELEFNQVHEIVVNVEPWVEQNPMEGDWDGGVHWHDVAHRRLTGEYLREFLIYYPRCNRLQGLLVESE